MREFRPPSEPPSSRGMFPPNLSNDGLNSGEREINNSSEVKDSNKRVGHALFVVKKDDHPYRTGKESVSKLYDKISKKMEY